MGVSKDIYAHVINQDTGEMLARKSIGSCPRVGDELRLPTDRYFVVKRIVWCLDEHSNPGYDRINIGVVEAP